MTTHPMPDYRSPKARAFGEWLMAATGDEWCGNTTPPGDNLTLRIPMDGGTDPDDVKVYSVGEDATTLWVGYPNEWRWHMSRREARRLAWFVLWRWWIRKEWFGLRRWLWFRGLHLVVPRSVAR